MSKIAIVFVTIISCNGCGVARQNLPVDIWIDDGFSVYEEGAIVAAIESWELVTNEDIFNYRGRQKVADFNEDDYLDSMHVIYKVMEPNESILSIERRIKKFYGIDPGAWANLSDIVVLWYKFQINTECMGAEYIDDTPDCAQYGRYIYQRLRYVVTHELGHFLGMHHNNNLESVMCLENNESYMPSPYDMEVFCEIYDDC